MGKPPLEKDATFLFTVIFTNQNKTALSPSETTRVCRCFSSRRQPGINSFSAKSRAPGRGRNVHRGYGVGAVQGPKRHVTVHARPERQRGRFRDAAPAAKVPEPRTPPPPEPGTHTEERPTLRTHDTLAKSTAGRLMVKGTFGTLVTAPRLLGTRGLSPGQGLAHPTVLGGSRAARGRRPTVLGGSRAPRGRRAPCRSAHCVFIRFHSGKRKNHGFFH